MSSVAVVVVELCGVAVITTAVWPVGLYCEHCCECCKMSVFASISVDLFSSNALSVVIDSSAVVADAGNAITEGIVAVGPIGVDDGAMFPLTDLLLTRSLFRKVYLVPC